MTCFDYADKVGGQCIFAKILNSLYLLTRSKVF